MVSRRLLLILPAAALILLALPSPEPVPVVAKPACPGGLPVAVDLPFCTHGPDPQQPSTSPQAASTDGIRCDGDGVAGKRVQVILARATDVQTTLPSLQQIRDWTAEADDIFDRSAAQTGGTRHLRFVTNPDCSLRIDQVTLPPDADDTFANTVTYLRAQGYASNDRKYLAYVDSQTYCGMATLEPDDTKTVTNKSNTSAGYSRVDRPCWGGPVAAHELTHNFGGVQLSAPHSDDSWHCTTEADLMCYGPNMTYPCPPEQELRLDCNKDDYFHTNPPSANYLASHWNVADSAWFINQPAPPPPAKPKTCWTLPVLGRICH